MVTVKLAARSMRAAPLMSAVAAAWLAAAPAHADQIFGGIAKIVSYQQTGPSSIGAIGGGDNAMFYASLLAIVGSDVFDQGALTLPGGSRLSMQNASGLPVYESPLMTPSALDAAFPSGGYKLTATSSSTPGSRSITLPYFQDAVPGAVPQLTGASYTALEHVDPSQGVTLDFNSFTPDSRAANPESELVLADLTTGSDVPLNSSILPIFEILPPSATSFALPGGALTAGHSYELTMYFLNATTAASSSGVVADDTRTFVDFTVGAAVLGAGPGDAILPSSANTGISVFDNPTSGDWYDPASAHAFHYTANGGDFASVGAPPASLGFGPVKVVVGGTVVDILDAGATYTFGPGVTDFWLKGITPPVDPSDPSAFPTYLTFSGNPLSFSMIAAPEPSSWALMLLGGGGAGVALRRSRKRARPGAPVRV